MMLKIRRNNDKLILMNEEGFMALVIDVTDVAKTVAAILHESDEDIFAWGRDRLPNGAPCGEREQTGINTKAGS